MSKIVIFIGGAAIGAGAAYFITKKKYEQISNEEIESVQRAYADRLEKLQDMVHNLKPSEDDCEDDISVEEKTNNKEKEYEQLLEDAGYADNSNNYNNKKKEVDVDMAKPYVITPEEYDENGYDTISLTYYADGVLTDEFGGVIEESDIAGMVGADFAEHFGEYEDDSVFVRNDEYEIDYEILKDLRNYSEIE